MKKNKKLLILTYNYEPAVNPRSIRWTRLAREFVKRGMEVDVVAGNFGVPLSDSGGVRVYSIGSALRSKLSADSGIICGLKALIRPVYLLFRKSVMWPDANAFWISPAVRKASELIETNSYDYMISVSHPYSSHVAGLKLKKKYPQLKWFVDIGDPFYFLDFVDINNKLLYKNKNFESESEVLEMADGVSVTTQKTKELYEQYFPHSCEKIKVIPPLLGHDVLLTTGSEGDHSIKRLVYVGTLYKQIRNPRAMLDIFSTLSEQQDNLQLHIYGDIHDCNDEFAAYKDKLGKTIFLHGVVNRKDAQRAIGEADILVNIGNKTSYQLPSKVVEYSATGKMILNILSIGEDSSLDFFKDYPLVEHVLNFEITSEQLDRLIKYLNQPQRLDSNFINNWVAEFRIDSIARRYLLLFSIAPQY